MKRNVIAGICIAVVAAAIWVPLGIQGVPAPDAVLDAEAEAPAATASAQGESGSSDGAAAGDDSAEAAQADAQDDADETGARDGASETAAASAQAEAGEAAVASAQAGSGETAAAGEAQAGDGSEGADRAAGGERYRQGAVLVGLQDGMTAADLNARLAELDYIATKQVADDDIAFGYVELALADGVSVEAAEARIAEENPDVIAAAQPNYVYRIADDATGTAGGAAETIATAAGAAEAAGAAGAGLIAGVAAEAAAIDDAYRTSQWALDAVNAYDAWDVAKAEGAVTVAILDTGIDSDHEDLYDASNNRIRKAANTVKVPNRVTPGAEDVNGHGTHVAGIVAATANNGIGVAGLSYNADIIPVKVLRDDGEGDSSNVIAGLDYITQLAATDKTIRVLNLSLGGDPDDEDDALLAALAKVHTAGILVVYAAGNDAVKHGGAYIDTPCDLDDDEGAIGVISVNQRVSWRGTTYERSSFSNYNKSGQLTKDLCAPGGTIYSTTKNGRYGYMSGTSMAAPCVSGIAALMFAANPGLTAAEARNIMCNTAQDLGDDGRDDETGYGLVDAGAAVAAAKKVAEAGSGSGGGSVSGSGSRSESGSGSESGGGSGSDSGDSTADDPTVNPDGTASTLIDLSGAAVTLPQERYTFTGSAIEPPVSVSLGGETLTGGSDFSVSYSGNVNVGTAKVKVAGKGAYTGSAGASFTIVARQVTPTVALSKTKYVYSGGVRTPGVTVKANGKTLGAASYAATYSAGRKAVGKYTVTVRLKGNYTGSASKSFTIVPKATALSSLKAARKGFTAKWKKQTAQTTGYQLQYSLKSGFNSGNKTITIGKAKTVSKKVAKLRAKKRYYVRVRAYKTAGGVRYYSSWSAKRSVMTKA